MVECHIFYSGRVQGVGFRFTVQRMAVSIGVCGWVRNCSDGRVELIAQASKELMVKFVRQIDDYFQENIDSKDKSMSSIKNRYQDFRIVD